jgi:acetyl-CoA acetyltransferase
MGNAVIVSTARTAIGTAFKGTLVDVDVDAFALSTHVVSEAVRRSGVDPALIDDVVFGESRYVGGDIARYAAIEAGLDHVPGVAREEMDAWALRSHQRAVAAIDAGSFVDEIVPLEVTRRDGTTTTFAVDEHPRRCAWARRGSSGSTRASSTSSAAAAASGIPWP